MLLAEDRLTDAVIAKRVGVSSSRLYEWKRHPDFSSKVQLLTTDLIERARRRGLARLDRRIDRYTKRAKQFDMIVSDRANDMKGEVPGGRSGFLVRTPKRVLVTTTTVNIDSDGIDREEVETTTEERYEYPFDAALAREMRELEKLIAQEVGDFTDRVEHSGKVESVVIREIRVPRPEGLE